MSEFYGRVSGKSSTEATRCGSKNSGIRSTVETWGAIVSTAIFSSSEGVKDHDAYFRLTDKHGNYTGFEFYFDPDAIGLMSRDPEAIKPQVEALQKAVEELNMKARVLVNLEASK